MLNVTQAAIDELREAGFDAQLAPDTAAVPFVPIEDLPTFERKKALLDFLKTAKHVGGARLYAEGVVFYPPNGPPPQSGFPFDEPNVMARYGL